MTTKERNDNLKTGILLGRVHKLHEQLGSTMPDKYEIYDDLKSEYESLKKRVDDMKERYEVDGKGNLVVFREYEVKDLFEEMLDDCHPNPIILGREYTTSRVLRAFDRLLCEEAFDEFCHFDGYVIYEDGSPRPIYHRLKEEFRP